MSTRIFVCDEALAQIFVDTTAEMDYQVKVESADDSVAERKVISMWDHFRGDFTEGSFSSSVQGLPATTVDALSASKSAFDRLRRWVKTVLRQAQDRLYTLADQMMQEANRLKIAVPDFLARMRRRLFMWVLRNSAVEQFDIGNDSNTKLTFKPKTLNTKGSFEFGRLDSDFKAIADVIGFLKIPPSISIEIDVEYDKGDNPITSSNITKGLSAS
jgi:hypothetical protein